MTGNEQDTMPLVHSVSERCRVCYTCVRECPAKAIKIVNGQAEVMPERCIGCGNCVRVCSQGAKAVRSGIPSVKQTLAGPNSVTALVAPSFPASFPDMDHRTLVGMIKKLGFDKVCETAFGADLVAAEYRRTMELNPDKSFIATTCPAVVSFIEYYHPGLVKNLIPVVSPMIAAARAIKQANPAAKVVFIGPCIAKKAEADNEHVAGVVDGVLTFIELLEMLNENGISKDNSTPDEFDPPRAGKGRLFALTRGLLETAGIREDLVNADVVASDGRENFVEAINEFELGSLKVRLLEVLCCEGCIMGAGMTIPKMPLFKRRALVSSYVKSQLEGRNHEVQTAAATDLSRSFRQRDRSMRAPSDEALKAILEGMGKFCTNDELNCGACGYATCRLHAAAIHDGFAEAQMCLPYTIDKLKETIQKLADSNEEVAAIGTALAQSEKLASMGQLAAGVAHEVNNPLGIVLMYAHLLLEKHGVTDGPLSEDLHVIVDQADRCKRIIAGLLDFARQNKVLKQRTNMTKLLADTVKSVNLPPGIKITIAGLDSAVFAEIDPDQVSQVILNLLTNAQAAMRRGGTLKMELAEEPDHIVISISDTGVGIPPDNLSRIFDPFFTTKQIGTGTGLGLAVVYGIIKMHRGSISVKSNADPANGPTGTTFVVKLLREGA